MSFEDAEDQHYVGQQLQDPDMQVREVKPDTPVLGDWVYGVVIYHLDTRYPIILWNTTVEDVTYAIRHQNDEGGAIVGTDYDGEPQVVNARQVWYAKPTKRRA